MRKLKCISVVQSILVCFSSSEPLLRTISLPCLMWSFISSSWLVIYSIHSVSVLSCDSSWIYTYVVGIIPERGFPLVLVLILLLVCFGRMHAFIMWHLPKCSNWRVIMDGLSSSANRCLVMSELSSSSIWCAVVAWVYLSSSWCAVITWVYLSPSRCAIVAWMSSLTILSVFTCRLYLNPIRAPLWRCYLCIFVSMRRCLAMLLLVGYLSRGVQERTIWFDMILLVNNIIDVLYFIARVLVLNLWIVSLGGEDVLGGVLKLSGLSRCLWDLALRIFRIASKLCLWLHWEVLDLRSRLKRELRIKIKSALISIPLKVCPFLLYSSL